MKKVHCILLVFLFFAFESFSQKVRISCPPKTQLKKDVSLGYLNFRGAQIGEIYSVKLNNKEKIKSMTPIGFVGVDPSNLQKSQSTLVKHYKTSIEFVLNASAEVNPTVLAQLKNELSKEMSFYLYNSYSEMVKDPSKQIKYLDPNIFPVKSGEVFVLINRVTKADSLIVKTETGLDINANATIQIDKYGVELVNNCSGIIQLLGSGVPTFFEIKVFRATVTTKRSEVKGFGEDSQSDRTIETKEVSWTELEGIEFDENNWL